MLPKQYRTRPLSLLTQIIYFSAMLFALSGCFPGTISQRSKADPHLERKITKVLFVLDGDASSSPLAETAHWIRGKLGKLLADSGVPVSSAAVSAVELDPKENLTRAIRLEHPSHIISLTVSSGTVKNGAIVTHYNLQAEVTDATTRKGIWKYAASVRAGIDASTKDVATSLFERMRLDGLLQDSIGNTAPATNKNGNSQNAQAAASPSESARPIKASPPAFANKAKVAPAVANNVHPAIAVTAVASSPSASGFAEIGNVNAIPGLNNTVKNGYLFWMSKENPRAIAVSGQGTFGSAWGGRNVQLRALASCESKGPAQCWIYAIDDRVVWDADENKRWRPKR